MKYTPKSRILMEYFSNHPCVAPLARSRNTDAVLLNLLSKIEASHAWLQHIKKNQGASFYNYRKTRIHTAAQIPKPVKMSQNGIPPSILSHIHERTLWSIDISCSLTEGNINRQIKIHFVDDVDGGNARYVAYADRMLMWIHLIDTYAAKHCSQKLTVFVYLTSLFKQLPAAHHHVLSGDHVNTAFTTSCDLNNEIIVFRREEWMKVFMHETFHSFGLDFSAMDTHTCHARILETFNVKSDVNLFEAYTEFWAETMNVMFCSYFLRYDPSGVDKKEFLSTVYFYIEVERQFSVFQMAKALNFMGLSYCDLYSKQKTSALLRQQRYREKTNVLAYYVIKTILITNFHAFLAWCQLRNGPSKILQFRLTAANQHAFCEFIEAKYKTKPLLAAQECAKDRLKRSKSTFLEKTMRMTVCEMDG